MELERKSDCDAAIKSYQQLLEQKPKSPDAYAGLVRCYLKKKSVTEAYETVSKGLEVADGPPVHVALGEVLFRQGKISEDEKLKLSELPRRPGQTSQVLGLDAEDDDSPADDVSGNSQTAASAAAKDTAPAAGASSPQDRYIAPEMQAYTRVYRSGHDLLIPTKVGDVPGKLFLLDTGAMTNSISPEAARGVTKVHGDPDMIVKGVSGSVKKVYSANKAVLRFGKLRQENQDMLSIDMSKFSDEDGTEVSGFLGFVLLRFLDIKIDYRDDLVDFSFDQNRFGR
jgi:hypothetical protein